MSQYTQGDARLLSAAPAMLALLRDAEWKGSAGRCPWCREWPAVPEKGVDGGHAEDCPLAALLREVSGE